MKKILIYAMVCLGIVANAQGRREGQNSIQGQYGYMPSKGDLGGGTILKLEYGRVIGEKGFLGKAGIFYHNYKVGYVDKQILPYQKYGLNAMGGYSYEELSPFYINAYFGGFGAYEVVNNGKDTDLLYNAKIPTDVKGFSFGLVGNIEMELMVANGLSIVVDYTQFYDLKSKFSKSNYGVFGGIKYYIN